jgi:hypothetical protein
MNPLETYLQDLHDIYVSAAGVPETSGYGPLANLFNEVGKSLTPRVRCIINIANKGAGIPDGGFFTPDQFQKRAKGQLIEGQLPSRGAVEVKPTRMDIDSIAGTEQVRRYVNRYQQVLVTNYRDFVLIGLDASGSLVKRERFTLAPNEKDFWKVASHSRATSTEVSERFIEYLKRVMLHAAPLTQPRDVAWFLASYARDAKIRIESSELPALAGIRNALEEALGLRFEGEKGEHFFRSTLVQTLFYGIFSAWVLWSKKNRKRTDKFDWRNATWELHVPMIKVLFEQIATPTKLQAADLVEVLNWTGDVLNRVDRAAFFANFEESHAVQYFYEPFLEAFDPELRKELGVWFTPTEVVKYMVARVDTVLREELDIADGLADPRVHVLDPCCGTGAYLVEVLHRIHETLKAKGEDALAVNDLKRAAMDRVFGFEILPAPFVVSHLQLGLLLQNLGASLSESTNERVGIYLTNSLTGWEPPSEEIKARLLQLAFSFAELKQEHDLAEEVKRQKPILVILGNPPYNAYAGVSPEEEQGLVEPYKEGLISKWGIKKFNLDDLYVRFFRLAERRIVQKEGIVSFISNFSYLRDPSFVVMRQRFLSEFDKLWFDSMNGDSRETGKLTPDGKPDPSVFSTKYNREGIRVGTAISLMVRKARRDPKPIVRIRQFWGVTKRAELLASIQVKEFNEQYEVVIPRLSNRLSFAMTIGRVNDYLNWPSVDDIANVPPMAGFLEARRGALVGIDREALEVRMKAFYDSSVDWDELDQLKTSLTQDFSDYRSKAVRAKVLREELYDPSKIRRYTVRPFDNQWCYHSTLTPLWNRARPELYAQTWSGNRFLVTRLKTEKEAKGSPFYFSSTLVDYQTIARNVSAIPLRIRTTEADWNSAQNHFFEQSNYRTPAITANLSGGARAYLATLGIVEPNYNEETASLIWMHALAIGYSPSYLKENANGIRGDWPRVPLPSTKELLIHSAELGRRIAELLDTESSVHSVTAGKIVDPFRTIGTISHAGGKPLNPAEDLKVTAGWGHAGKGGITMPGKGRIIERDYSSPEREAIERAAQETGLSTEEAFAFLGERTFDVYLNDVAYWKNITTRVWDYMIGGYQVIKKWLSYRELGLLGRPLTPEEAREVMNISRRIAAIVLMEPALDQNYQAVKSATYDWTSKNKETP